MNALKWLGVAAMVVVVSASARSEDDKTDYAKLIVGKWEVTKSDEGSVPAGALIEFTKDGKLKATIKKGGEEENVEGTYKVVKNTFEVTIGGDGGKMQTITISKINDKEMVIKDKDDKVVELKKTK